MQNWRYRDKHDVVHHENRAYQCYAGTSSHAQIQIITYDMAAPLISLRQGWSTMYVYEYAFQGT